MKTKLTMALEVWLDNKRLSTIQLWFGKSLIPWSIDQEFHSAISITRFFKEGLDDIPDERFTLKGVFIKVQCVDVPVGTYKREYST